MKPSVDLSSLAADYEIVGELDAPAGARTYIATRKGEGTKRRDDRTGVIITVVTTPEGDEANALSQLAADTKLLARTSHRRLTPVIEGRWLGDDAFAVVTQRSTDPSLAERLAAAETFTNPRIAAILREVNGLLEWARDQKIVHRGIPTARVFLEPNTDRVRVSFAIAPILRLHPSDAQNDARTIAKLAVAMLTGEPDPRAHNAESLAELRPDLPERLRDATSALLDESSAGADIAPDITAFLALIGMADPVAAGEAERERIRAEILEEQRAEREKLATERETFERTTTEERASFERTMADEHERLERERLELQKAATRERDELQRAVAAERAQLVARRDELERTVSEQRAELERAAAQDRQQIAALRDAIQREGEHEVEKKRQTALDDISDAEDALDRAALSTPIFLAPMLAPIEPLAFDDSSLMRKDEIVFAPPSDESLPSRDAEPSSGHPAGKPSRRTLILSGSLAAVIVLVGITASVLGSREPLARSSANVAPKAIATPAVPDSAPVTTMTPPVAAPAAAALPLATDSASIRRAARWLDSLKEAHPVELPRPVRVVREPAVERAPVAERAPAPERPRPSIIEDPFFIPGSTPPPQRDTVVRRDSAQRPDTAPTPPR